MEATMRDLFPAEEKAYRFMIEPHNRESSVRPPYGTSLAKYMGYRNPSYAYRQIKRLVKLGYLDKNWEPKDDS